MKAQRDAFIDQIYEGAKLDKNIMFLSADFGAPSLDRFRNDLPEQFVHLGISEQNMMNVAIGLSHRGKRVFAYAMAPFISLRAAEQHKLAAMMESNVCVIVAGVGLGYANAGPTHYASEDFMFLNGVIGAQVYTASDSRCAEMIANEVLSNDGFSFVRLDRQPCNNINEHHMFLSQGYRLLTHHRGSDFLVVTQGYTTDLAREWIAETGADIDHADLLRSKPLSEGFKSLILQYKKVLVIDEQVPNSSLGTLIAGSLASVLQPCPVIKALSLEDLYAFENNGRGSISEKYGLNRQNFRRAIEFFDRALTK